MKIEIPDKAARRLGDDERAVLEEIVVHLYKARRVSGGLAREMLYTSLIDFQHLLASKGEVLNYQFDVLFRRSTGFLILEQHAL